MPALRQKPKLTFLLINPAGPHVGTKSTWLWYEQYLALVWTVPCLGMGRTLLRYWQYQALERKW